jgi:hypothetical protein
MTRDQWISLAVYLGCLVAAAVLIAWGAWSR